MAIDLGPKKTMTLNLPEREMEALEAMCVEQGMSKTALLRHAFRLYQSMHVHMKLQGVNNIFDLVDPVRTKFPKISEECRKDIERIRSAKKPAFPNLPINSSTDEKTHG